MNAANVRHLLLKIRIGRIAFFEEKQIEDTILRPVQFRHININANARVITLCGMLLEHV